MRCFSQDTYDKGWMGGVGPAPVSFWIQSLGVEPVDKWEELGVCNGRNIGLGRGSSPLPQC